MQYHHPACGDIYDSRVLDAPNPLPGRSHANSFSPFYLFNNSRKVPVPWCAIARDQPPVEVDDDARLAINTCTHRHVVVLRVLNIGGETVYGWFAKRQSNLLERLTKKLVVQIGVVCTAQRPDSSLLTMFPAAWYNPSDIDIEALPLLRFERKHALLTEVALKSREENPTTSAVKKASTRRSSARLSGKRPRSTCVVCMEDSPNLVAKRCGCKTPVCTACSKSMRGLCPVCDRGVLNAHFECHSCSNVDEMSQSGFPCVTCGQNVVCHTCYRGFEECFSCDSLS